MEYVIPYVRPVVLHEIAQHLECDPFVGQSQLSTLSAREQEGWLANNRSQIVREISLVGGHTIANTLRGHGVPYIEIVRDLADKFKVEHSTLDLVDTIETNLILRMWNTTIKQLTPVQLEELKKQAMDEARRMGKNPLPEAAWIGALGAAQLSGFGVYLISTTILGAISGALGLGLGMGIYVGLTKLIAVLIGPVGWIFGLPVLGLVHFGAPNYKKLLPVVLLIAAFRDHIQTQLNRALRRGSVVGDVCEFLLTAPDTPSLEELCDAITYADYVGWPQQSREVLLAVAAGLRPSASDEQIGELACKLCSSMGV